MFAFANSSFFFFFGKCMKPFGPCLRLDDSLLTRRLRTLKELLDGVMFLAIGRLF